MSSQISDRPDKLFGRYRELVGRFGSDGVLALVEGCTRSAWLARLAEFDRGEDRIFTLDGWIRRELELWWPLAESGLEAGGWARPAGIPPEPLFVPADVAQGLMSALSGPVREPARAFAEARTPPALIDVQLLDILGAAVLHRLDLAEAERLLLAGCGNPDEAMHRRHVRPCLEAYRDGMLRRRLLDRALAAWVFERYVLGSAEYRVRLEALVAWQVERPPPLLAGILDRLSGGLEDGRVSGWGPSMTGPAGSGSQPGPLLAAGADSVPGTRMESGADPVPGPLAELAAALLAGRPAGGVRLVGTRTYPEMLGKVAEAAASAFATGRSVAILVPGMTPLVSWWFRRALREAGVPLVVKSGTYRLTDHAAVRVALALAAHAFPATGAPEEDPDLWQDALDHVDGDAERIAAWAEAARAMPLSLAGVFRLAFGRLLAPDRPAAAPPPPSDLAEAAGPAGLADLPGAAGPAGPADLADEDRLAVDATAQLVRTAERFEAADARLGGTWGRGGDGAADLPGLVWRFREFLLAGRFAQRPHAAIPLPPGCVQLSTLARFGSGGEPADLVLLADASSQSWLRSGAREICNVHVLDPARPAGSYSPGEALSDARKALAAALLRAAPLAAGELVMFASLFDAEGGDQPGGLADLGECAESAEAVPA